MAIRYTGFADEAASGIEGQIAATLELGWSSIESRTIDGVNIIDLDDAAFDRAAAALEAAGVRIDCFGSAVANWSRDPRKEADFRLSLDELKRAIPRMRRLGTRMLRGMSFAYLKDAVPDSPEITRTVIEKVGRLVRLCEEAGIVYLHENCMNYGGMSYEHTLRLLDAIPSPAFSLVFDTGNPVFTENRVGKPPYARQSAWEFYDRVKERVTHVHVKDGVYIGPSEGIFPKVRYTWPGEGDGEVGRILADLVARGYEGFLSIEPHMETVFHEGSASSPEAAKRATYVEYGRRLMALVAAL
jgi:sugar phosphate isomerase/epimerase